MSRPAYIVLALLAAVGMLAGALAILWSIGAIGGGTSEQDRAAHAAVAYAESTTLWMSGPTARTVRLIPLRGLEPALQSTVSRPIQESVNVPDLIRRYGPNRPVALVVLNGVYNSLPPGEGIVVHGDVVAVVDTRSNHVLLLTA